MRYCLNVILLLLFFVPHLAVGQLSYVRVSGPTTVQAGLQQTYTVTFYNERGFEVSPPTQLERYWYYPTFPFNDPPARFVSQTDFSLTIEWRHSGVHVIGYEMWDWDSSPQDYYTHEISVTVTENPSTIIAPIADNATAVTSAGFTANWNAVSQATGYRLDVSTSSSFSDFVSGYNGLAVAGTSQVITGIASGTSYYYRVRAVKSGGAIISPNSNMITAVTLPSPPAILAATSVSTTGFTANWASVQRASTYFLQVSTSSNFVPIIFSTETAATSRAVSNLGPSTLYYYRVYARNFIGQLSVSSSTRDVTTLAGLPPPPVVGPATNVTAFSFTANWAPVLGANAYGLEVSSSSSFSPVVFSTETTGTNYSVPNLAPSSAYYYRMYAKNITGTSPYSSTSNITTLPTPVPIAGPATGIASSSFTANWSGVPLAGSYRLDVSTRTDFSTLLAGYNDLSVNGTSVSVTGLDVKTSYYYRVRAVNVYGTSASSNTIRAVNLDANYIRTTHVAVSGKLDGAQVENGILNEKMVSTQFFDGTGRPIQTVAAQASPAQKDIIQPIVYDDYGREVVKYLPYAAETNGWRKMDFVDKNVTGYSSSPHYQFYQTTPNVSTDMMPFSQVIFEASPLNRVLEQGAPGQAWQPDASNLYASVDRTIKSAYETNRLNEVLKWTHIVPGASGNSVYYASGQLYKTMTKDEHHHEVIEYIDKEGRTVLKKVETVDENGTTTYAETYYVYDDFGNLVVVLPPEATKRLQALLTQP